MDSFLGGFFASPRSSPPSILRGRPERMPRRLCRRFKRSLRVNLRFGLRYCPSPARRRDRDEAKYSPFCIKPIAPPKWPPFCIKPSRRGFNFPALADTNRGGEQNRFFLCPALTNCFIHSRVHLPLLVPVALVFRRGLHGIALCAGITPLRFTIIKTCAVSIQGPRPWLINRPLRGANAHLLYFSHYGNYDNIRLLGDTKNRIFPVF
jgi:hypothetical protein